MKNIKERSTTIDVMKCILIILVVIGHYSNINATAQTIIFWFHMPLFFIIGGYLFKIVHDKIWVKNTIIKYLIPYLSYFTLISLLQRNKSLYNIMTFLYGGRMYSGVFWFIPCMLITILVFHYLNKILSKEKILFVVGIMYILAHIESIFYLPHDGDYLNWSIIYKAPLNLDVCLMSIVYFSIGFYCKDIISRIIKDFDIKLYLIISLICIIFIFINMQGILSYSLNMKLGHYYNLVLDILIPCLFGTWILMSSMLISKINNRLTQALSFIGISTIPIMYLHLPLNGLVQNRINYGIMGFMLIGIVPALIFIYICSKNKYLEFLFKGKSLTMSNSKETVKINNLTS